MLDERLKKIYIHNANIDDAFRQHLLYCTSHEKCSYVWQAASVFTVYHLQNNRNYKSNNRILYNTAAEFSTLCSCSFFIVWRLSSWDYKINREKDFVMSQGLYIFSELTKYSLNTTILYLIKKIGKIIFDYCTFVLYIIYIYIWPSLKYNIWFRKNIKLIVPGLFLSCRS